MTPSKRSIGMLVATTALAASGSAAYAIAASVSDRRPHPVKPVLRVKPARHYHGVAHIASPPTPGQLRSMAVAKAKSQGEVAPTDIQTVHTNYSKARDVMEPGTYRGNDKGAVNNTSPVYVITMTGNFIEPSGPPVLPGMSGSPAPPSPPGHTLTMIVDATTGDTLDWGIEPYHPKLSDAGPVTNL